VDPEACLTAACAKFSRRFRFVEGRLADAGLSPTDASLDQMEAHWAEAKAAER